MNWSSENHRQGFSQCTPTGYTLSGIAYFFFLLTLISPFAVVGVIGSLLLKGDYEHSVLILFLMPLISYIITWLLNTTVLRLAERKGFKYDYEKDECTWN